MFNMLHREVSSSLSKSVSHSAPVNLIGWISLHLALHDTNVSCEIYQLHLLHPSDGLERIHSEHNVVFLRK